MSGDEMRKIVRLKTSLKSPEIKSSKYFDNDNFGGPKVDELHLECDSYDDSTSSE